MNRAYLYIVSLAFLMPLSACAAEVHITSAPSQVGVGDRVAVTVSVDTRNALNSFAGTLTYDPALLSPVSISDGNSISTIWLTHPQPGATSTPFIGFASGGFVGQGELFTEVFTVRAQGDAQVTLAHSEFLQNDGQGTAEPITVHPLSLSLTSSAKGGYQETSDTTAPEPFTLALGKDTAVFDGATYLAFAPTDKGSGIDHIEVGETRWPFITPAFSPSDSPYLLHDQYLTSRVVVRAYDHAGNARTTVFPRTHVLRPHELIILGTLIVLVVLWLFLIPKFRRRSRD